MPDAAKVLLDFQPNHDFFVGIDSDGCAFDAMEIKHKECFIPNTIKAWNLQAASSLTRETCEFVNLYSKTRGVNRWIGLVRVFDLLRERPEVMERGAKVPSGESLKAFIASGYPLSNPGLRAYMSERLDDAELRAGLTWSLGVDDYIEDTVTGVPPFPNVRDSLQMMHGEVDLLVVSATPLEALVREWGEHGLAEYMDIIAGQEMGTKSQHLEFAAKGKYPDDHILLIGDAPGDRDAALSQGALYYPINPGQEAASWKRFREVAYAKFLDGTYAGAYQQALITEFEQYLPELPAWQK
jgi:phosphoglycolate phosphatase-like HAD superfamily hydrolase